MSRRNILQVFLWLILILALGACGGADESTATGNVNNDVAGNVVAINEPSASGPFLPKPSKEDGPAPRGEGHGDTSGARPSILPTVPSCMSITCLLTAVPPTAEPTAVPPTALPPTDVPPTTAAPTGEILNENGTIAAGATTQHTFPMTQGLTYTVVVSPSAEFDVDPRYSCVEGSYSFSGGFDWNWEGVAETFTNTAIGDGSCTIDVTGYQGSTGTYTIVVTAR